MTNYMTQVALADNMQFLWECVAAIVFIAVIAVLYAYSKYTEAVEESRRYAEIRHQEVIARDETYHRLSRMENDEILRKFELSDLGYNLDEE